MKNLLDKITDEYGISAALEAISQILDEIKGDKWRDVITTSDVVRLLTLGGIGRNDPTVRTAVEWLNEKQDKTTGSWNNEVLDTSSALRALGSFGLLVSKSPLKEGIKAICDQFDETEGCWWDIWETCQATQCLISLGVEADKTTAAVKWLLAKKYPKPDNWLNLHTTAAVLETVGMANLMYEDNAKLGKAWLQNQLSERLKDLDEWTLALALRALNRFPGADSSLIEKAIKERLVPAIFQGRLDTVDLCQVGLTLLDCAPRLVKPKLQAEIVNLADQNPTAMAELFITTALKGRVSGLVQQKAEADLPPYMFTIGVTRRQFWIVGLIGSIASIVGLILWLFS